MRSRARARSRSRGARTRPARSGETPGPPARDAWCGGTRSGRARAPTSRAVSTSHRKPGYDPAECVRPEQGGPENEGRSETLRKCWDSARCSTSSASTASNAGGSHGLLPAARETAPSHDVVPAPTQTAGARISDRPRSPPSSLRVALKNRCVDVRQASTDPETQIDRARPGSVRRSRQSGSPRAMTKKGRCVLRRDRRTRRQTKTETIRVLR